MSKASVNAEKGLLLKCSKYNFSLQTLRQDSNDGYHVAKERDFSETKLDRQDSFETLDSVEVDQVPLSKFDQPSNKNSIRPKGDFPAPPPNL